MDHADAVLDLLPPALTGTLHIAEDDPEAERHGRLKAPLPRAYRGPGGGG